LHLQSDRLVPSLCFFQTRNLCRYVTAPATETLDCPPGLVGRVIGKGGETIKGLQAQSGAHITIDQNFPDGEPRKIAVSGPRGCVVGLRTLESS
jgi:hypothetical protein